jgi:hypothetical protein
MSGPKTIEPYVVVAKAHRINLGELRISRMDEVPKKGQVPVSMDH